MKKNNIGYLLREGVRGVFLHGFMSFAAVCVTVACLIIMGTFSLILYNLHVMIVDLEQENEVLVYIDESYSEAQAKSVGSQINMISNVLNAKFVSREEALQDFAKEQNDATMFSGLDSSTFRDRYVVTMEDNSLMQKTVDEIRKIDGVAEVTAHYEISNGFQTLQKVLNIASMIIIIVLFVVSLLIISNTVKLAMYDRREEIAIMKMVGATNSFIRLPFVVEGFILGFLGAAIGFFLEWGLYDFLESKITTIDTLQLITIVPFREVIEMVAIAYAITGFIIGVVGSLLSIRKFLKV
jgi:cell division transport system permease protein